MGTNTTSLVPVTVVHLVHTPSSITVPYQAVIVDRNVMMMLIALFMLPYRTVIMSIAQHIQNAILSKHITVELSGVVHFLEKSNQIQGIHQCTIMVMVLVQATIQCIMINIITTIIHQCTIMLMVLVQATIQCIMSNIITTIIHQCTIMVMVLVQATIQCIMINITTTIIRLRTIMA